MRSQEVLVQLRDTTADTVVQGSGMMLSTFSDILNEVDNMLESMDRIPVSFRSGDDHHVSNTLWREADAPQQVSVSRI